MSLDLERAQYLASLVNLTAPEAGELLRTTRHEIYRLVKAKRLSATRLGKRLVISRVELDRFMAQGDALGFQPTASERRRALTN